MSAFEDIFEAMRRGTVEDVRYFVVEKGVDVNAKNSRNETPLHCALGFISGRSSRIEIVKILVSAGADVNALSKDAAAYVSPLWQAEAIEDAEVVQYLRQNRAEKVFKIGPQPGGGSGGGGCLVLLAMLGASLTAGICGLVLFVAVGAL